MAPAVLGTPLFPFAAAVVVEAWLVRGRLVDRWRAATRGVLGTTPGRYIVVPSGADTPREGRVVMGVEEEDIGRREETPAEAAAPFVSEDGEEAGKAVRRAPGWPK